MSINKKILRGFLVICLFVILSWSFVSKIDSYKMLPRSEDWKIRQILTYINRDSGKGRLVNVGLLFNCYYFSVDILHAQRLLYDFDGMNTGWVHTVSALHLDFNDGGRDGDIVTNAEEIRFDYILAKTGKQGNIAGCQLDEDINRRIAGQMESSSLFEKLPREFILPDSSVVTIFKRKDI